MKRIVLGVLGALALAVNASAADQGLKDFMAKSKSQRLAVVAFGDSNQQFGGHGWNKHMRGAILDEFGSYGTGVVGVSSTFQSWAKPKGKVNKGAPENLAEQLLSYWYLPDGEKQRANWNLSGYIVAADHQLDITGSLKYRIRHALFAEGQGAFQPAVRMNKAPWKTLFKTKKVSTAAEASGTTETALELPADPARKYPLLFSIAPVKSLITGPFLGEYLSVQNIDKQAGCSYQTLYAAGGHSLLEMVTTASAWDGVKLENYFGFIREELNADKSCLVMINSGLNDRNRSVKSSGPEKTHPSNSKEGYKDNLKGLVAILEKNWIASGGTKETIYFAFMPSHPISSPDDKRLVAYRQAAAELAESMSNASVILLPELVPQKTMVSEGHYDKRGNAHLTQKGYQEISKAVVKSFK